VDAEQDTGPRNVTTPPSLHVQVVVYHNDLAQLRRLARGTAAAIDHASAIDAVGTVTVAIGDCSPRPSLEPADLEALRADFVGERRDRFAYEHFDANLGSGGGSNRLMASTDADVVWILNPDTYPAPTALARLLESIAPEDVAAVDARQLPIEHPKSFDPVTGEAAWVSGACMLVRRTAALAVNGFDDHFFPMYCDDVDVSWRLRLAGWKVRHAPLAAVYHDKRLDADGRPAASDFEHGSGLLSRLFLAHRYGRPDVVEATLAWAANSELAAHRTALAEYRQRLAAGDVPPTLAGAERVADLDSDYYGPARFSY
jgi:GT2 family glycosyltransferase